MNESLKEIKKQPEEVERPAIKKETDTACGCGCMPPPWKDKALKS